MKFKTFHHVLALATLTMSPLFAQLDPRLQACKTDVLDIYSGGKTGARPEIITLIDNSGSTSALAWDSRFYTNTQANIHVAASQAFGTSSGDGSTGLFRVYSSNVYNDSDHGFIKFAVRFGDLWRGLLIKPDGNPVTSSDVSDPDNWNKWVAQASHVRFAVSSDATASYTYNGISYTLSSNNCNIQVNPLGSNGSYSSTTATSIATPDHIRVVDIPIPWAVFDRVPKQEQRTLSPTPAALGTAVADKHPQHTYLFDPVPDRGTGDPTSTAQYYEVETTWWESLGNGGYNGDLVDGSGNIRIRMHPEYLAWCFFGQDVRNPMESGAFWGGMIDKYTGSNPGNYTVADARDGAAGFLPFTRDGVTYEGNGLPNMTRFQAIKYAIIKTYIKEQLNVWWAIRFLNGCASGGGFRENGRSSPSNCFDSGNLKGNPGDRMLLRIYRPSSANNPHVNLQYIQRMQPDGWTPLTFGLLNTYAQLASTATGTNGSVFNEDNDPYKGEKPIPTCRRSFVIVLSDGNPNDDDDNCDGGDGDALGSGDPFAVGTFNTIPFSTIAPTKTNFNLWTLAGVVAHVDPSKSDADTKSGWPTDNDNSKVLPPFKVSSRPTGFPRRISTMTIGISMTGTRNDADGAKGALYKTALYGWEHRGSFSATNLPLPYMKDVSGRNDKLKNPFFFEAQSPDDIADALSESFGLARSVTNTMSAPVAPLLGLTVGNQMYVGSFTSATDTPAWKGDLMMMGMKYDAATNSYYLTHRDGQRLTDPINVDSAVWATSLMLDNKGWKNRNLFTLKPSATDTTKFTTTILDWNESTSTSDLPNTVIDAGSTAQRLALIRYMMGGSAEAQADTAAITSIGANRDDIMGDIIHSTPAIVEFPLTAIPSGSSLATWYASNATLSNLRFRLLIVGTNQGILHAFGEVSGMNSEGTVKAAVDELWGFIPPDLLSGLRTWYTGKIHRYLVDGSPTVYLNEQGIANGRADGSDVLRVIFGLRKGGRSYYCLSFEGNNPSKPKVAWMIRPDDSTDATIKTMGFSSSTPVASRVLDGTTLKDVFLIGGGLSTSDVDAEFAKPSPAGYGSGTVLGRSIIAVNVSDGTIIKKWDFANDSTLKALRPNMNCIPSGVVPVEVITNSYKTQRIYFTDFSGGLHVIGSVASSGLRQESSNIGSWSIRTLFKSKYNNTIISTTPAIFPIPFGYPVVRSADPKPIVPSWGVAVGTGDRNDPMDNDPINPGGGGIDKSNRFVLLLDRLDSADITTSAGKNLDANGFTEDDLADLTTVSDPNASILDPSNANYYLKTKFGYFLDFAKGVIKKGTTNEYFYEKQVTSPLVINKVLFFTKFAPSVLTDVCSPSGGTSTTYRMNNVLAPVYASGGVQATNSTYSGWVVKFNDIPSELASLGMGGAAQLGEYQGEGGGSGNIRPELLTMPSTSTLPRPRAWRIVR